jgi:hypothetical protein
MSEAVEKLQQDLTVLEAMVAEMPDYLRSDVLYWRMMPGGMPMLTIGGYLMRQERLQALSSLLSEQEQQRLATAVQQFEAATREQVVRVEMKANEELERRIRQWGESLKDGGEGSRAYYQTAVENRAIIATLVNKLQNKPFELNSRLIPQVNMLDSNLRNKWQSGDFIWPAEWEAAYPRVNYWWLYGQPR